MVEEDDELAHEGAIDPTDSLRRAARLKLVGQICHGVSAVSGFCQGSICSITGLSVMLLKHQHEIDLISSEDKVSARETP